MPKIIAVTNQKGGVGKTTSSVNLAASMAALEKNVLLIDLDPQGNATMGSGVDKHDLSASINEVLLGEANIAEIIVKTPGGYALAPSNSDLTIAEITLLNEDDREQRLQGILAAAEFAYDYIFLDCPPSLNMLTVNALVAAQGVLIPMQCEYFALEGLTGLLETISNIQVNVNPELKIAGILRTLYDGRNSLSNQVSQHLAEQFPEELFKTVIPRNVRLAEAPSHGLPALLYDRYSAGAAAYMNLAREILSRDGDESMDVFSETKESDAPPLLRKRSESSAHKLETEIK